MRHVPETQEEMALRKPMMGRAVLMLWELCKEITLLSSLQVFLTFGPQVPDKVTRKYAQY